jgi:ketosteroid isomerase-like protein
MSEENVELVRQAFEGRGLQHLAGVAQTYWHRDVVYVEDPRWPGASRYDGRDAVLRCFQAYVDALGPEDAVAATVERVVDAGARQVALVRFEGRSASGVPHDHVWGYLIEIRDRRIVYFRAYYDPEEALEAAGSEP